MTRVSVFGNRTARGIRTKAEGRTNKELQVAVHPGGLFPVCGTSMGRRAFDLGSAPHVLPPRLEQHQPMFANASSALLTDKM
jgi:hypothetical protein